MAVSRERRAPEINTRKTPRKAPDPPPTRARRLAKPERPQATGPARHDDPRRSSAPGEEVGAFQKRLDDWLDDTNPRNVLELTSICAMPGDNQGSTGSPATSTPPPHSARPRGHSTRPRRAPLQRYAEELGASLMFSVTTTAYESLCSGRGPAPTKPNPFDDAPRDVDALGTFKEGIEWLLHAWSGVLPHLPQDGAPTPAGSDEFLRRNMHRTLRLLGIPTGAPAPEQPIADAAIAEVLRLQKRHRRRSAAQPNSRLDADLSLFGACPDAQLLLRYEIAAERELHRSIATFLKLRKDPDLIPAPQPSSVRPETCDPRTRCIYRSPCRPPKPPHSPPASPPNRSRRAASRPRTETKPNSPALPTPLPRLRRARNRPPYTSRRGLVVTPPDSH